MRISDWSSDVCSSDLPGYRPHVLDRLVTGGVLSDAQLESLIYAGQAHAGFLAGHYAVDGTFDTLHVVGPEAAGAVRFRGGWLVGAGAGAGKGPQVACTTTRTWPQGRRRAPGIPKP